MRVRIPAEISEIIILFFTTRVVLTVIGVVARALFEPVLAPLRASHRLWWVYSSGHPVVNIWGVADTEWYLDIARNGYSTTPRFEGQVNLVFFPMYPGFMKGLGAILGDPFVAGVIISNAALLVACVLLYRLVRLDEDDQVSLNATKYLLLFPAAFVLSGVLSESLYLALLLGCFFAARRGRWALAGVLGLLLSLTRVVGVFAFLPLLYEYYEAVGRNAKNVSRDIFYLLLIPCGLLIFVAYQYALSGDVLAFVHHAWGTGNSDGKSLWNPLQILLAGLFLRDIRAFVGAIFTLGALAYLFLHYRQLRFSYWFTALYSIVLPLMGGSLNLYSMPRYLSVVFPLAIILSKVRSKNPLIDGVTSVVLAILQGGLMVFWTNGAYLPL